MKKVTGQENLITIYDVSDRAQVELLGADRAKFLHGFCTNDIKALLPGQGCEAFLTNIKGRVLGHVFVFATSQSIWLDTVPGQGSAVISHLDRYLIREDVQFVDRSAERGELLVTGRHAAHLLMLDPDLPRYGSTTREALGRPFDVRRVDLLGEPGYLLSIERSVIESTRISMLAAGCVAGTAEQLESRRIEAGFPVYGRDITEDNIAQEVARTPQCISFTKGCYLGQEPIARLDAMGHTNRELRRVLFNAGSVPASGAALIAADSDEEAGRLTSVAPLASESGTIATLGYLKTKFSRPETRVRLSGGDSIGTVN